MTAYHLNQNRLTLYLAQRQNFQWHLNQNAMVLIPEISFQYAACNRVDISLGPNVLNYLNRLISMVINGGEYRADRWYKFQLKKKLQSYI